MLLEQQFSETQISEILKYSNTIFKILCWHKYQQLRISRIKLGKCICKEYEVWYYSGAGPLFTITISKGAKCN